MEQTPKYQLMFTGEKVRLGTGERKFISLDGSTIYQLRYMKYFNNLSELHEREQEQLINEYNRLQKVQEEITRLTTGYPL